MRLQCGKKWHVLVHPSLTPMPGSSTALLAQKHLSFSSEAFCCCSYPTQLSPPKQGGKHFNLCMLKPPTN